MPHIHELIDFTVAIYVVYRGHVLMIHHKGLDRWLPLGGHVEPNETPEAAAIREAKEESGLDVELIGVERKPKFDCPGTEFLLPPAYMDIHDVTGNHRHIGMVYFATSKTAVVKLADAEHHDIRWLSPADLADPAYDLSTSIAFYAREAFRVESGH